jgi:hypothetical protein
MALPGRRPAERYKIFLFQFFTDMAAGVDGTDR